MFMRLPPFSALRAFEAAARLGSFRAAAQELNLTESAVSHQVRRLEAWLGQPLFERAGRGLSPTQKATEYSQSLGEALGRIQAATARLTEQNARTLTISAPPAVAHGWLLPRLARFQAAHPDLTVRLHPTTRPVDFAREPVDVGLRYSPREPAGLYAEHLLHETAYPVVGPAFLAQHGRPTTPAALCALPRVHNALHPGEWRAWAAAQGADATTPSSERDWDAGMDLESADAVLRAAIAGLGAALGRRPLVDTMLAEGSLLPVTDGVLDEGRHYWFVCPVEARRRPAVRALRDWLHTELKRDGP